MPEEEALLRVLPGDWRPYVVAPRMLVMDQEGRLGLKVGQESGEAVQVEGFVEEGVKDEEVLDDGVVLAVDDAAVDDFIVEDIIVEETIVDDAVVDDACFVDDATVNNAGAEDVIEEDAVVESAAVDEGAGDDATDDTVAAEDDALNEADELGRLLQGRTLSVFVQRMTSSLFVLNLVRTQNKARTSTYQTEGRQFKMTDSVIPETLHTM